MPVRLVDMERLTAVYARTRLRALRAGDASESDAAEPNGRSRLQRSRWCSRASSAQCLWCWRGPAGVGKTKLVEVAYQLLAGGVDDGKRGGSRIVTWSVGAVCPRCPRCNSPRVRRSRTSSASGGRRRHLHVGRRPALPRHARRPPAAVRRDEPRALGRHLLPRAPARRAERLRLSVWGRPRACCARLCDRRRTEPSALRGGAARSARLRPPSALFTVRPYLESEVSRSSRVALRRRRLPGPPTSRDERDPTAASAT